MRNYRGRIAAYALVGALLSTSAWSQGFSTSVTSPTPVPATGTIAGAYPSSAETSYYFAADLKAGELATQISMTGRPNRDKKLEFDLLGATGRSIGSYYVMSGLDANQEAVRVFPIDASGRYTVRVRLTGPETTSFAVSLGGSAFPAQPGPAAATPHSVSFLKPSPVSKDGVITGRLPGGDQVITYYYFAADLKAGDLLSQISVEGRPNAPKMVELELLGANGRRTGSYYLLAESEAKRDATRSLPVDRTGRHVLRISVKGAEGTAFKVELGGTAFVAQ